MTKRLKLQVLVAIEVLLIVAHKIDERFFPQPEQFWLSWTYLLALGLGVLVVAYALSLRCGECGARQVFRGLSFFDIRWPEESCHACGRPISSENG